MRSFICFSKMLQRRWFILRTKTFAAFFIRELFTIIFSIESIVFAFCKKYWVAIESYLVEKLWEQEMALTLTATHATADANVGASEFLAFQLGQEEYGIDIQKVQEIRAYEPVTRMANALPYVKGVVNLRGIIVPIIDMRIKLELGEPTYDHLTVVIILNIAGRTIGMVVDRVSDVITLTADQIKPAPDMGSAVSTDYLVGLGTIEDRMLVLVDIDRLMTSDDMGLVAKLAA